MTSVCVIFRCRFEENIHCVAPLNETPAPNQHWARQMSRKRRRIGNQNYQRVVADRQFLFWFFVSIFDSKFSTRGGRGVIFRFFWACQKKHDFWTHWRGSAAQGADPIMRRGRALPCRQRRARPLITLCQRHANALLEKNKTLCLTPSYIIFLFRVWPSLLNAVLKGWGRPWGDLTP